MGFYLNKLFIQKCNISKMVKLFVGNIAHGVTDHEVRSLFEKHGKVTECDVLGSFGFVHMESDKEAEDAISKLDKYGLRGQELNVEKSKSSGSGKRRDHDRPSYHGGGRGDYETKAARRAGCTKLHVADVPNNCSSRHLRNLFERFGRVSECDIVEDRNIAFVHIDPAEQPAAAEGKFHGRSRRGNARFHGEQPQSPAGVELPVEADEARADVQPQLLREM